MTNNYTINWFLQPHLQGLSDPKKNEVAGISCYGYIEWVVGWVQSVRSTYKSVIFKSLEKCNKTTNSRKCLYSEEFQY